MASIKITERDLTTPGTASVNTNVAYVPGYAVMGPVNEPILCSTVTEFKQIFGIVPYKFEQNETLGNSTYRIGDFEKSYIYALELLRAGMPILFERIPNNQTKASKKIPLVVNDNLDYGLTINAKYPGSYGKDIYFELKSDIKTLIDGSYAPIILKDSTFINGTKLVISDSIIIEAKDNQFTAAEDVEATEELNAFITENFDGLKAIEIIKPLRNVELADDKIVETDIKSGSQIMTYTDMCTLNVKLADDSYSYRFSTNPNSIDFAANKTFELIDLDINVNDDYFISSMSGFLDYSNIVEGTLIPEFTVNNLLTKLNTDSDKLTDRGTYQIKFITSGAYPTYEVDSNYQNNIAKKLLTIAAVRGDAIALIDHSLSADIINIYNSISSTLASDLTPNGEDPMKYGAMFTPWGLYNISSLNMTAELPASFAYLKCLANSVKTNASWNAVAGVTRGYVIDLLSVKSKITGAVAELLQSRTGVSINPITEIKPYGNCIWGNRTLFNNRKELTASSFLNIRMLSSDIKKKLYEVAKELTFELNSEVLWLNFKSKIIPTLDQMVSGNGLSGYKIIKTPTDKKATVACTIKLYAIEAVEDWDITIELSDSYISVE